MNILLITTDQHLYDTALPDFPVELKGIKRLRKSGMFFTNAFTPTAQCSPARASLLTGLLPHAHGMFNNCHNRPHIIEDLPVGQWTYTRALKEKGFLVGQVGRWHISKNISPMEYGVDDYINEYNDIMSMEERKALNQSLKGIIQVREPVAKGEVLSGVYANQIEAPEQKLASKAMDLMEKYAESGRPWHLRVEFGGPHVPWIIPEKYDNLVDSSAIKKPINFDETFANKPTIQKRQHRSANLCSCYHDWDWASKNLIRYYGYIALLDDQIDSLLNKLDTLGMTRDTMVIFTSDHGEMAGAHNRIGKGELPYDEIYHIPMVVSWPGHVKSGSICDEFVMLHDLCPTMLSAAGIDCPNHLHARNFMGLLLNEPVKNQGRKQILMEHHGTFQPLMIRILRDKYGKYCFNPFDFDEFYNLEEDPGELINLINDPSYQSIIQDYRSRLLEEQERVGEKWSKISYWFLNELAFQEKDKSGD